MMRIMLAGLGAALLLIAGIFLAPPWLIQARVAWDCNDGVTELCLTRMRAAGHVWSRQGDLSNAEYWYRRAAQTGDSHAMFHLGWLYDRYAQDREVERLTEWQALDRSDRPASDLMAEFDRLRQRTGTEDMADLAAFWYRRSAEAGFAPAMNNLGQYYLRQAGGQRTMRQALGWYERAARAGNPLGAWNLSIAYMAGQGVEFDPEESRRWATWTPPPVEEAMPQLASPICERTYLFGSTLPNSECRMLRQTAKLGEPATMEQQALRPDPSLPTFDPVDATFDPVTDLSATGSSPTRR